MQKSYTTVLIAVMSFFVSQSAFADGFGINATRLIYLDTDKSISVTVRNTMNSQPYLVQSSVSMQQDRFVAAPFIVTPPLFRLEPKSVNQIRIAYKGEPLPDNKESVFYFTATGIPSSQIANNRAEEGAVTSVVRFGVGNIIKIFYRPSGLQMSSTEAQKKLLFKKESKGLKAVNDSPYFINIAKLNVDGVAVSLNNIDDKMIPPFAEHFYPTSTPNKDVTWLTINDLGGVDAHNIQM